MRPRNADYAAVCCPMDAALRLVLAGPTSRAWIFIRAAALCAGCAAYRTETIRRKRMWRQFVLAHIACDVERAEGGERFCLHTAILQADCLEVLTFAAMETLAARNDSGETLKRALQWPRFPKVAA